VWPDSPAAAALGAVTRATPTPPAHFFAKKINLIVFYPNLILPGNLDFAEISKEEKVQKINSGSKFRSAKQ